MMTSWIKYDEKIQLGNTGTCIHLSTYFSSQIWVRFIYEYIWSIYTTFLKQNKVFFVIREKKLSETNILSDW